MKHLHSLLVTIFILNVTACTDTPSTNEPQIPPVASSPIKPAFTYEQACELPSMEAIASDPVVRWAFEKAVYDGLIDANPEQNAGLVTEEGGWIRQCKSDKGYHLDAFLVKGTYRTNVSINLDDATYYPGTESCRTVGSFHLHPHFGKHTPSEADRDNGARRGVPSFLIENKNPERAPYRQMPEWGIQGFQGWAKTGKDNLSWECPCNSLGSESGFSPQQVCQGPTLSFNSHLQMTSSGAIISSQVEADIALSLSEDARQLMGSGTLNYLSFDVIYPNSSCMVSTTTQDGTLDVVNIVFPTDDDGNISSDIPDKLVLLPQRDISEVVYCDGTAVTDMINWYSSFISWHAGGFSGENEVSETEGGLVMAGWEKAPNGVIRKTYNRTFSGGDPLQTFTEVTTLELHNADLR